MLLYYLLPRLIQSAGPLPIHNFTGSTSIPLPSSLDVSSKVPAIAYKIPDLEAFAQLTLSDVKTNEVAACIQATLSNGWSSRQPAVSAVTGGIAIFAILSGLLHTILPSTPLAPASSYNLPSLAPTRFVDYILLVQQVAMSGFLHLNFPLVYRAFSVNFSWAFGLFTSAESFQNAINRMRHLTGGTLEDGVQSPVAFVDRNLSPYNVISPTGSSLLVHFNNLFAAAHSYLSARDATTDSSAGDGPPATVDNSQDVLPAGIPLFVNAIDIGTANAFMSVFLTVLIGFVVAAAVLGVMYTILTFMATRLKGNKWAWTDVVHAEFGWFAASIAIRCCMIALYPILIFGFFQWTLKDSWLADFLAAISIISIGTALLYPAIKTILISRRESPQALFTVPVYVRILGAFSVPFRWQRYYFFMIPLIAAPLKSAFISFAKTSGLAQVIGLLIIEVITFVLTCALKPYRSRGGDILGIYLALTRLATAALMIPFVESLHIKPIPRVAIGVVVMVIFSISIIILTINLILNFGNGLLWRRHIDNPLGSSSAASDIEKADLEKSKGGLSAVNSSLRPQNPTPTTSFSHEVPSSRHNPQLGQAISPNYTIPSFAETETDYGVPLSSALSQTTFTSQVSRTQSPRFSATPPSTGQSGIFNSRRQSEQLSIHHDETTS